MSDFGPMAISAAIVLLAAACLAWEIRSILRAQAADALLLAHGDLCYAKVVSARETGTLINDQPVCVVRLVDIQAPATRRDLAQAIATTHLQAIQAGCTVALRVDRRSGRALIDFTHS